MLLKVTITTTGFPYTDGKAVLDGFEVERELDGELVDGTRTPVARSNLLVGSFPSTPAFAFNNGLLVAPGELSLGEHELILTVLRDGVPRRRFPRTFIIEILDKDDFLCLE